jgi:hypothetical protein
MALAGSRPDSGFFQLVFRMGVSDDVTRGLELATAAIGRSLNANAAP